MKLERHDVMHATEIFDLSREDRRLHMNKLRGETVNQWLFYGMETDALLNAMRISRLYKPE